MIKYLKTRAVDQGQYTIYWNKAEEFYEMMQHAFKNRMWTAVGLNAVHCVISSCDALSVKFQGLRSSGEDHMQTVDLLTRIPVAGVEKQVASIRRIIAKKNAIAYDNREFRESDAAEIFKQVERFYQWVFEYLNKK